MYTFKALIGIIGINPFVEVPDSVLEKIFKDAAKGKGPIPVKGTLNGHLFTQTLVKYKGMWRLYLNTPMRTASNTIVGDRVTIEIAYNKKPHQELINPSLKKSLDADSLAKIAFDELPPYRQKELSRYLNNLKSEEAIHTNIEKIIKHLHGQEVDSILFYKRNSKK